MEVTINRYCFSHRPRRPAFTLLELMVVLVVLGLLASIVTPNVVNYIAKGKVVQTRSNLTQLQSAVIKYYADTGDYPDESVGLEALVSEPPDVRGWEQGGYLLGKSEVPLDGWGNEFIYQRPSVVRNQEFDIISYGADGEEGGEDMDADIYNSDVAGVTTQD